MSPNVQDMILAEMKELRDDIRTLWGEIKDMREESVPLRVEVERLKVKSGVWGALAGLLPAVGVVIWMLLKN